MNNVLLNKKLFDLLDKYSDNQSFQLGKTLEKIISDSQNAEMIVPVLGMQGMGKSTLINAILGECILPSTADETTCIPVEVKYGENEYAEVYFQRKRNTVIIHSSEELSEYVDNNYNRANEKSVSRIVLYRKCELLRSGMVIVDLPGVGSLTNENAETTNRYIQNLCTAIFVIPTAPTLRKIELIFIKGVWSQFSKAIFVQNDWNESKREIRDSVDFNSMLLKQVSKEINAPFDGEITVVNVLNALKGKLDNNEELIHSSNIDGLILQLQKIAQNWNTMLDTSINQRTLYYIDASIEEIEQRINQLDMDEKELEEDLKAKYDEFHQQNERFKSRVKNIKVWINKKKTYCSSVFLELSEKYTGKISAEMTHVIDCGVFDGEALSSAFKNIQEEQGSDYANECFNVLMDFRNELEEEMEELVGCVDEENDFSFDIKDVNRASRFKFEQFFTPFGSIGGSIGGGFAGTAVGGVVTAALAGSAIGAAAGPIGVAAGIVVGIVCGVAGTFLGKGLKTGVEHLDKTKAKSMVDNQIIEIQKNYNESVNKKFNEMVNRIIKTLDGMLEKSREEEKRLLKESINNERPQTDRVEMTDDKKTLEEIRECLKM